jgi:hypothetical protein
MFIYDLQMYLIVFEKPMNQQAKNKLDLFEGAIKYQFELKNRHRNSEYTN